MQGDEPKVIKVEVPPGQVYRERTTVILTKSLIALLVIFVIGNLGCLALFFLNAFRVTYLTDAALCALAAATVAEVTGLIVFMVRVLTHEPAGSD